MSRTSCLDGAPATDEFVIVFRALEGGLQQVDVAPLLSLAGWNDGQPRTYWLCSADAIVKTTDGRFICFGVDWSDSPLEGPMLADSGPPRELSPGEAFGLLIAHGHAPPRCLQGRALDAGSAGPAEMPRPGRQAPKYRRGELDERAVAALLANPTLSYDQLAEALGCRSSTLRDKSKCPRLHQAIASIRLQRESFRGGSTWRDRRPDDDEA